MGQGKPGPAQITGMPPPKATPWNQGPQPADQAVLDAIDELQAGIEDSLAGPMQAINNATINVFIEGDKTINKITKTVNQTCDKCTTRALDQLDLVLTQLINALNIWQQDIHFVLTQIVAKAGWTSPGMTLELLMQQWQEVMNKVDFGPPLVLSVKEAIPHFDQLIEVLREIRDRLPPIPLHVVGEPPAHAEQPDEPLAETGEAETPPEEAPLPQLN